MKEVRDHDDDEYGVRGQREHEESFRRGKNMENRLAENIRSCRKDLGLTQEQLAERLGITLGTVSKWERGNSEPDLGYIMELAELFHRSVDALIGFSMRGTDADAEADRIAEIRKGGDAEAAAAEYETALKKFPNQFRIVCEAAETYRQIGAVYKKGDATRRALELYRRAIGLISQNRDPDYNEVILRNEIAGCYRELKEYKKAVEEYRKNNQAGNNDAEIGLVLIHNEKLPKEGIAYTERAFVNRISDLVSTMYGYVCFYRLTGDPERGIRASEWTVGQLRALKEDPEKKCYLDKIISLFLLSAAIDRDRAGKVAESEESLREAVRIAREFDADPVKTLENIVFAEHAAGSTVYDNAGPTAIEGLKGEMKEAEEYMTEEFKRRFEEAIR